MRIRKKSDLSRHSSSARPSAAEGQKAAENAHTDAADCSRRRRSKTLLRAAFCYARDQDYSADRALSIGSMSVEMSTMPCTKVSEKASLNVLC